MPTYKNESTAARHVINADDRSVWVYPGQSVQTEYLLTESGWTRTSDEPYFNPLGGVHAEISSTGPGDPTSITLAEETNGVEIYNNSDADVTVLLNAAANTPGYIVPANTVRELTGLRWYVDTLVLQFSAAVSAGGVIIHELGV